MVLKPSAKHVGAVTLITGATGVGKIEFTLNDTVSADEQLPFDAETT